MATCLLLKLSGARSPANSNLFSVRVFFVRIMTTGFLLALGEILLAVPDLSLKKFPFRKRFLFFSNFHPSRILRGKNFGS